MFCRLEREAKIRQAQRLKTELDGKLDSWRKQVLEVQARSIKEAEARAQREIRQRKQRVQSESRKREVNTFFGHWSWVLE